MVAADGKCYQVVRMYVSAKSFYEKIISDKKAKDKKNRRAEQVMAHGSKLTQNMAVTVLLGAITVGCVPQRRNAAVLAVRTFLMNIAPVDGVRFECEKPIDESFSPFGLTGELVERERAIEEQRMREEEKGVDMGVGGEREVEAEVDDVEGVGESEMRIEDAMRDAIGGIQQREGGEGRGGGGWRDSSTHRGDTTGTGSWSESSEETKQRRGSADSVMRLDALPRHTHTDMNCGDFDRTADSGTVLTSLKGFDHMNVSRRKYLHVMLDGEYMCIGMCIGMCMCMCIYLNVSVRV